MDKYHFYKRVREGLPTLFQSSLNPLDDPGLEELTEEEYNAEVDALNAAMPQPEPSDEATEADLLDALTELGVIP